MDPSGHEPKYGDGACYEIDCKNANGTLVGNKIIKPTPTPKPSNTPTPSPSNTSVPTPTGTSVLDKSQELVKESEIGDMIWDWGVTNGYSVAGYAKNCNAHGGKDIVLNPCKSAVFNAGTIAHEIMHDLLFKGSTGSLQEEYMVYMVGDAVRAQLIVKGYGTSSDMFAPLTDYTVKLENNPNLEQDLKSWFKAHGIDIYYRSRNEINGTPTGWGVPPFPLTFTPKP